MTRLNRDLLKTYTPPAELTVSPDAANWPERVLQFGEGGFLRAFVDWMFHQLNKQGLFNGRVVVVQPIEQGLVDKLNEQDGLYTLLLRGLENGKPTERNEIISCISRGINPYSDWQAYLACAENPDLEFIVSNTTEAGIAFNPQDSVKDAPPASFPGKLTAFLYHRFQHFNGAPERGMTMLPCELIDRNGDNLKKTVLQTAAGWGLPQAFGNWIEQHNIFANTLVDRVVTGYPRDEVAAIQAKFGYEDELIDAGELFHLWVIEAPQSVAAKLPFAQAGLNVVWTDNMAPYRTRKVRILNGAHTGSVPAAFLYGLDTVGEMMEHPVLGRYVRSLISDELIPSINLDRDMLTSFADAVVERFENPYIKHYLLSILLNSSSKFKTRNLPSLLEYRQATGEWPEKLTFALSALISVYRHGHIEAGRLQARRDQGDFVMQDDLPVLEFFVRTWAAYDGSKTAAQAVAETVLANAAIWGQDLSALPGLTGKVADYLWQIDARGMQATLEKLVEAGN
ncbi:MAG: tagaturonate reductase [Sporomusaceae bacterium]|nr:tagaturonate reductase [Sporomusaceae bacterium]